jgi:hypothetical protein
MRPHTPDSHTLPAMWTTGPAHHAHTSCAPGHKALNAPPLTTTDPPPPGQDLVGARTKDGRKLRRSVLKGSVIVFVTAGYSGKRFIFQKAKELGVRSVVLDGPDRWGAGAAAAGAAAAAAAAAVAARQVLSVAGWCRQRPPVALLVCFRQRSHSLYHTTPLPCHAQPVEQPQGSK